MFRDDEEGDCECEGEGVVVVDMLGMIEEVNDIISRF